MLQPEWAYGTGMGLQYIVPLCHKNSAECTFCGDSGVQPAPDINFTDDRQ